MTLIHIGAEGQVDGEAEANLARPPGSCNGTDLHIRVQPLADYDGDGEAELYVEALDFGPHHEECTFRAIYGFHGGRIERMSGTEHIVGVEDVDHDGLEDLLEEIFVAEYTDCAGYARREAGPPLLAHARDDGTFDVADAVAQRYARRLCPRAPPRERLGSDVVCARLWGASAEEVHAAVGREIAVCLAGMGAPEDEDPCSARGRSCARPSSADWAGADVRVDLSKSTGK